MLHRIYLFRNLNFQILKIIKIKNRADDVFCERTPVTYKSISIGICIYVGIFDAKARRLYLKKL